MGIDIILGIIIGVLITAVLFLLVGFGFLYNLIIIKSRKRKTYFIKDIDFPPIEDKR